MVDITSITVSANGMVVDYSISSDDLQRILNTCIAELRTSGIPQPSNADAFDSLVGGFISGMVDSTIRHEKEVVEDTAADTIAPITFGKIRNDR